jgi:glycerophosphoryl diester phosphodiesterase
MRPLLLGHRGARAFKSIPENTLASFDRALADGCDGFEFDVRLTADGAAVICHDPQFQRTDIARASIRECAGLPRLKDVLARYCDRAFLDIELKVAGLEKITAALVRKHTPQRGYVVSSFLPQVLEAVHSLDAGIPLGLICETRAQLQQWNHVKVDYIIAQQKLVDRLMMDAWKNAGKKTVVWTVNSSGDMQRLRDWGVDGLISDDTKLLTETLA